MNKRFVLLGLSWAWLAACGDSGTSPGGGTSTGGTASTGGEGGGAQGGEAQGGFGQGGTGGGGPTCETPPVATASNDGPACDGDTVTLTAEPVAGATYQWTGPNGFTSTEQNPTITGFDEAVDGGMYTLIVTVDGCASAPATTNVGGASSKLALSQTLTGDFNSNQNTNVSTASNHVVLGDGFDYGSGADGAFAPASSTTLAGGNYQFSSVNIPAGVTVTITGGQPLVIRSTGTVTIAGVIEASGDSGTPGVTFMSAGVGGLGRAGGGDGGNGTFSASQGPLDASDGTGPGFGGMGKQWNGGGGGGHVAVGGSSGGVAGIGGIVVGTADLNPPTVGSGGGGGSGGYNCGSGGGGGGGGFVHLTAPAITIMPGGAVRANGGNGGSDGTGNCGGGGGGSGGAIQLSALTLSQGGTISATGGAGGASQIPGSPYFGIGGVGSAGRVRFDYQTIMGAGAVTPAVGHLGGTTATLGSTVSPLLTPNGLCSWGTLNFTANVPMGTLLTVDVLDDVGGLLLPDVASGTDLGVLLDGVSSIHVRANLGTTNNQTPSLDDWTLNYNGI